MGTMQGPLSLGDQANLAHIEALKIWMTRSDQDVRATTELRRAFDDHVAEDTRRIKELNDRLLSIEKSIQEILDIKRSTQMMLNMNKWLLAFGITLWGAIKVIIPLFHKSKG